MDTNKPDQRSKAEEMRFREEQRRNPIRVVQTDTMLRADVGEVLKLIADIRREREAQGLTPEQVADLAAVKPEIYSRFEAGHSFGLTIGTLSRIARAVGKRLLVSLGDANPSPTTAPPDCEDEEEQAAVLRYSMTQAAKVAKANPY